MDVLDDIAKELRHPVMRYTGNGEVEASILVAAAAEIGRARDRITRALAALDTAPDVDPAKATRAEVAAIVAANLAAWMVLTEGRDPPSQRGGEVNRG